MQIKKILYDYPVKNDSFLDTKKREAAVIIHL